MINRFTGKHSFLSNFCASMLVYEGHEYPTVEHAYQAAKAVDEAGRQSVGGANTARDAKMLGRRVDLRPDWEDVKVDVMRECLKAKFSTEPFRAKLRATGDQQLVEGNHWGDQFWGKTRYNGRWKGKNWLGKLLMELRTELQEKK